MANGKAGAPEGNQNGRNKGLMRQAILSRLEQKNARDQIAAVLVDKALSGDMQAIKEVLDRIDGKSVQQTVLSGDEENPIAVREIIRKIIDPSANS